MSYILTVLIIGLVIVLILILPTPNPQALAFLHPALRSLQVS